MVGAHIHICVFTAQHCRRSYRPQPAANAFLITTSGLKLARQLAQTHTQTHTQLHTSMPTANTRTYKVTNRTHTHRHKATHTTESSNATRQSAGNGIQLFTHPMCLKICQPPFAEYLLVGSTMRHVWYSVSVCVYSTWHNCIATMKMTEW